MTGFQTFGSGGGGSSGGSGGGLTEAQVQALIAAAIATKQDAGDYATDGAIDAITQQLQSKATQAALQAAINQFATPVKDAIGDLRMILAGMDTSKYLPAGTYIRAAYTVLAAKFPAPVQGALDTFSPRIDGAVSTLGMAWFKNLWIRSEAAQIKRSPTGNEGSWIVSSGSGGGRLAIRGDGNLIVSYSWGSGFSSVSTSTDGLTFTARGALHSVYGGNAADATLRLYPFPGAPGKFLCCGTRNFAGDQALLWETVDFTGTAGVRYPMAATTAAVNAVAFWPAAMLWVAAMSDGKVQTSPAGGTAEAPTITGPWTIRDTGQTGVITHILPDGNNLYMLAPTGRCISAVVGSPFNYVLSVLDTGVSGWQDAVKIGNTWLLTASSTALDGRSRIMTTTNFVSTISKGFVNGTLPSSPTQIAVGPGNIMVGESGGRYAVTVPLDFDPNLQFQIPPMPSGVNNAAWMVRALD